MKVASRNMEITICNNSNNNNTHKIHSFNNNNNNNSNVNKHHSIVNMKLYINTKHSNVHSSLGVSNDGDNNNNNDNKLHLYSPIMFTQPKPSIPKLKAIPTFNIKHLHINNIISPISKREQPITCLRQRSTYMDQCMLLQSNLSNQCLLTNSYNKDDKHKQSRLNRYTSSARCKHLPKIKHHSVTYHNKSQRYNTNTTKDVLHTSSLLHEDNNSNNNHSNSNSNSKQTTNPKLKQIHLTSHLHNNKHKPKLNLQNTNFKRILHEINKSHLLSLNLHNKKSTLHNKTNDDIFPIKPKLKIEPFPLSIITEHYSKTFYLNAQTYETTTIDFYIERIFDISSFTIYGICQGNEASNSFLIASTAKNTLIDLFTTHLTYNVSFNPISTEILKAITMNNYETLISVFKAVDNEIKATVHYDNDDIAYSIALVIVVGKEIIYVNYGKSVLISNIKYNVCKRKEQLNTQLMFNDSECDDSESVRVGRVSIQRKSYNKDIKYIIICNEFVICKDKWKNILKIIIDEKEKYFNDYIYSDVFYTLNDKIQCVYNYITKIVPKDKINFSIIIIKF